MRRSELKGKNIVIWGTGMEACAAAKYIRESCPEKLLTFVDERSNAVLPQDCGKDTLLTQPAAIAQAVKQADVIIKSPGVSLYHPVLMLAQTDHRTVTSLLNLWMAENDGQRVLMISGTKGKSTTATLLTHVLQQLGQSVTILGNFGVPVTACKSEDFDYLVLEVSSYQAANFDGHVRISLLTSLYPEHLDWHKTVERYYQDKCRLMTLCDRPLATKQALDVMQAERLDGRDMEPFDSVSRLHFIGAELYNGQNYIGPLENAYLLRPHNLSNVCGVMAIVDALDLPCDKALAAMKYYKGLPHRQQEVGELSGVLYVDDSISTTPQSAVAAMKVYAHRPITLIAGGQDRGIDFSPLADYVLQQNDVAVVCIGESGKPILSLLQRGGARNVMSASSMRDALEQAKAVTPKGGVILLSPASPSYDMYENYKARAASFLKEAGLSEQKA